MKGKGILPILIVAAFLFALCRSDRDQPQSDSTTASRQRDGPQVVLPTLTPTPAPAYTATPTPTPLPATPTSAPVAIQAVAATPISAPVAQKGIVNATALNVRAGPGTEFEIIGQLVLNECIDVLGEQGGWLRVQQDTNPPGWCSQQYITLVDACPVAPQQAAAVEQPAAPAVAAVPPASVQPASVQPASYIGQPFAPNAMVIKDTYLFECFGAGDNELRLATANTPVQVLGTGPFTPPYTELGSGPFLKNRIWDGQYAWIPAEAVGVDLAAQPVVSGICEDFDRIDWSVVTPPTATTAASRATDSPAPARSCCKVCRSGKACGDTCIAANRTCRVGPGCACNG